MTHERLDELFTMWNKPPSTGLGGAMIGAPGAAELFAELYRQRKALTEVCNLIHWNNFRAAMLLVEGLDVEIGHGAESAHVCTPTEFQAMGGTRMGRCSICKREDYIQAFSDPQASSKAKQPKGIDLSSGGLYSVPPPTSILRQAMELRALEPGWDSYGGPKISEDAIKAAIQIATGNPQLVPRHNGGVQLEWPTAKISFEPNGTQEFDVHQVLFIERYVEKFNYILGPELEAERDRQDARYGQPHDDAHERIDWVTGWGIPRFLRRAVETSGDEDCTNAVEYERAMISIAALAIAAVQSSRRKRNGDA